MHEEKWIVKYWRPCAAWTYLAICIFDFVIMPVWHLRSQGSINHIWELSMRLRPEDQLQAIVQLSKKTNWEPITLGDGAAFHLAFGAILGVAAWTRGRVQEAQVRNNQAPVEYSEQPRPRPPARTRPDPE